MDLSNFLSTTATRFSVTLIIFLHSCMKVLKWYLSFTLSHIIDKNMKVLKWYLSFTLSHVIDKNMKVLKGYLSFTLSYVIDKKRLCCSCTACMVLLRAWQQFIDIAFILLQGDYITFVSLHVTYSQPMR